VQTIIIEEKHYDTRKNSPLGQLSEAEYESVPTNMSIIEAKLGSKFDKPPEISSPKQVTLNIQIEE